jgi:putative PIG3 family NAD(P)H quinone oxidoreductase
MSQMRAITLKNYGGPEMMRIEEVEIPEPGPDQVRVKVMATSVNWADIVQRQGNYPPPKGESKILGLEVAGVIDSLGANVKDWTGGDRVMGLVSGGGYAEYALVYADHLIPIPKDMDYTIAAGISETYITAFLNIYLIGELKDGETALLHGGGGGVNTAAIQLCRTLTPKTILIVTASPQKVDRVAALGVDRVVNYKQQEFATEVRTSTRNHGADLIIDHIGADYLTSNLKALAVGGRLVIIGVTSGAEASINLAHLMVKRQRIYGSVLRSHSVKEKAQITAEFRDQVMPHINKRKIDPIIHHVYPLEAAPEAHKEMENSRHFGKIVLAVQ